MTSTAKRVPGTMSDSDALLWTIGRDPVLRCTVVAVLVLDRPPRWDALADRLDAVTRAVPRLRSTVAPAPLGWGRPHWVEDDAFDLGMHLQRMGAAAPATLRSVLDVAQVRATTAFDPELPLWEAVLIEGLEDGKAALVVKLHHAVADGVGGLDVVQRLLDRSRTRPEHASPPAAAGGPPAPSRRPGAWAAHAGRRLVGTVAGGVRDPFGQLARTRAGASSVGRLLAPAGRPLSPVLTGRSIGRRLAVLDVAPGALRAAATGTQHTLNDVFVTAVLGGLGLYHEKHGRPVPQLRVLMPISVRAGDAAAGGNHFVPARFVLPVTAAPAERLSQVGAVTASWKHAPGLGMSDVLATALDHLPPPLVSALWGSMLKGDDFVVTNVPGPPWPTYLAGALVERLYGFAPPSGAALNVSLITWGGIDCVGVNVDTAAVRDVDVLVDCLSEGFDEVVALAPAGGSAGP